jgi:hypothetical protein
MRSQYTFMRGYPGCTGADAPQTACTTGTAYGDVITDCDVGNGSAFSSDSNKQAREMRFKCDGSRGMSGSAIFTQNCPGIGKCAFGQYNRFICTGSACAGKTWVNTMGRLTKIYAQTLATLIAANP